MLKSQCDKFKRQNDYLVRESEEVKASLREGRGEAKSKDDRIVGLMNELSDLSHKSNQQ